jgi:hypothetical protein
VELAAALDLEGAAVAVGPIVDDGPAGADAAVVEVALPHPYNATDMRAEPRTIVAPRRRIPVVMCTGPVSHRDFALSQADEARLRLDRLNDPVRRRGRRSPPGLVRGRPGPPTAAPPAMRP